MKYILLEFESNKEMPKDVLGLIESRVSTMDFIDKYTRVTAQFVEPEDAQDDQDTDMPEL